MLTIQRSRKRWIVLAGAAAIAIVSFMYANNNSTIPPTIAPDGRLTNDSACDQDDMCVVSGSSKRQSARIIVADKKAHMIFSYTLDGHLTDSVPLNHPGNIDSRSDVLFDGDSSTVVVTNVRDVNRLAVFVVDKESRKLKRIDDGQISTIENYGGTLYHNRQTKELFFIATSKTEGAAQYRIINHHGQIDGQLIRTFDVGMCEGAVSDDRQGVLYIGEESAGVRRFNLSGPANPAVQQPGRLVVRVGENGLQGDVEGLAITEINQERCLVLSDQGASLFRYYAMDKDFAPRGSFGIKGARSTDGIDIMNHPLGGRFPHGIFLCHTDADDGKSVLITGWDSIAKRLRSKEI